MRNQTCVVCLETPTANATNSSPPALEHFMVWLWDGMWAMGRPHAPHGFTIAFSLYSPSLLLCKSCCVNILRCPGYTEQFCLTSKFEDIVPTAICADQSTQTIVANPPVVRASLNCTLRFQDACGAIMQMFCSSRAGLTSDPTEAASTRRVFLTLPSLWRSFGVSLASKSSGQWQAPSLPAVASGDFKGSRQTASSALYLGNQMGILIVKRSQILGFWFTP